MSTEELVPTYVGRHAAHEGGGYEESRTAAPRHRARRAAEAEGPVSYRPRHRAGERAGLQVAAIPLPRGEATHVEV